jgi:hypothetical protein
MIVPSASHKPVVQGSTQAGNEHYSSDEKAGIPKLCVHEAIQKGKLEQATTWNTNQCHHNSKPRAACTLITHFHPLQNAMFQ